MYSLFNPSLSGALSRQFTLVLGGILFEKVNGTHMHATMTGSCVACARALVRALDCDCPFAAAAAHLPLLDR